MSRLRILLLVGPAPAADLALVREIAGAEFARLGVPGQMVSVGGTAEPGTAAVGAAELGTAELGAAELGAAVAEAERDETCAVVVLPGTDPHSRALIGDSGSRTVWFDPAVTGPVEVGPAAAYLYGRGLWGLAWAIRHAVHRMRFPARRIAYGPHADQWGELRLPRSADTEPVPVAVLVHGGFWRSIWGADLMDEMAIDLAARGFASWNLEYRRPDLHGWDATSADVAAGLSTVSSIADAPLDLDRIAVLGHSAGGQLVLRAAADGGRMAVVASLAGVVDLAGGHRRGVGNGAIAAALGGPPAAFPDSYAVADPMARLPIAVPLLIVQGRQDDLDLIDGNRRFVQAARAAGDTVVHLEQPGDHFSVIDPGSDIWTATVAAVREALGPDVHDRGR